LLAGYEELFTYTIFAAWIFYALTAWGVIVLRHKMPGARRPYRVFGCPWVPLLFVVTAAVFVLNLLREKPAEAGYGALIIALGVPVYYVWKRKSEGRATS